MLEKLARGVIYTGKLLKQIEQIALHQARWCNWLTRRPLKAESTGSSPVRAISNHIHEGGCREPPFSFKSVIFRREWRFWQVRRRLATEPRRRRDGKIEGWCAALPLCLPIHFFSSLCLCGYKLNASFTNCACSSW